MLLDLIITSALGVPVIVKLVELLGHIVVVPVIAAVGRGAIVTVIDPVCKLKHSNEGQETLTKVYVKVPATSVGIGTVTLFDIVVETVNCGPPLIV